MIAYSVVVFTVVYLLFARYCYRSRRYENIMCHCWSLKPMGSVIVYWYQSMTAFLRNPKRETGSELCFASAYLHSYFILGILHSFGWATKIVYIGLPGDLDHIQRLKERFIEYGCIRGSKYLTPKYCPSHYYSYTINNE